MISKKEFTEMMDSLNAKEKTTVAAVMTMLISSLQVDDSINPGTLLSGFTMGVSVANLTKLTAEEGERAARAVATLLKIREASQAEHQKITNACDSLMDEFRIERNLKPS